MIEHRYCLTFLSTVRALPLTACAGADVRPIVDMKGVNEARYEKDLAECQDYAKQASGMGGTAAKGAGAGAIVGGLLGLVTTGGNATEIAQAAGAGAVIGGAGGAYQGNGSQKAIVKKCLVGRGYKVFN